MWYMWRSEVNFAESVLFIFAWAPGTELRSPAGSALPTAPAFGLVSFVAQTSLCQEFMLHSIIGHCPTSFSPDQQAMDWRPHLPQVQVSSCSVSKGLYKMAANCRCSVNVYCEPAAHSRHSENKRLCKWTAYSKCSENKWLHELSAHSRCS